MNITIDNQPIINKMYAKFKRIVWINIIEWYTFFNKNYDRI